MHRAFRKTPTQSYTVQDTTVLAAARTAGAVAVCKEGAPIWNTHAMGAGKNRGENRGWGYPSFITGQPGILVELTGVTQPIFMKWVTHVMSVTS